MRGLFTSRRMRVIGAFALLSVALSACSVQLAGFSSDYAGNHVSVSGSCNNSSNPTSSLYACTGGISGELYGLPFMGHFTDCSTLPGLGTTTPKLDENCSSIAETCHQIQTDGEFSAYGTGFLGGIPVTFVVDAYKDTFGSLGHLTLAVSLGVPPYTLLFFESFPKNHLAITRFNGNKICA